MDEMRISDPRNLLHLKKELTQIRKAARVLRDPGTTSSWKSPLNSSRSVIPAVSTLAAVPLESESKRHSGHSQLDALFPLRAHSGGSKDKRVFLYNWKYNKSLSDKSATPVNDDPGRNDDGGADASSSAGGVSVDDSLSDARNGGDSKSDTCLVDLSSSILFKYGDTNLVPRARQLGRRRFKFKKVGDKNVTHLDNLSRYKQKESVLERNLLHSRKFIRVHPSMPLRLSREDSIDQSDDTEDYSNSEDFTLVSGASPLLLKIKHKSRSYSSSKLCRDNRKEDSSYSYSTPALSASSYNKYAIRNPSTFRSWEGTATSMDDGEDELDDHLDLAGSQGCGIPCYWSKKTPKRKGICGSWSPPSLSDTLRRKGNSILGVSKTSHQLQRRSSKTSKTRRFASRSAQAVLPLLTNCAQTRDGLSIGTGCSDDELSTKFGELDLEALSRLDGRRWPSSCQSPDGLEIVALNKEAKEQGSPDSVRSFSQKYRPMFFDELIGQNIVVQSLVNAISRGRIAPVYLFQGPRGTGKTSTAMIFAAALNCLAAEEAKPCGYCRECSDYVSGKSTDLFQVDGTDKKVIERIKYLFKKISAGHSSSFLRYKVFLIDDCHLLSSKTWVMFLKFLEEPPQRVVFIFITTDFDSVPRTIQSRCQKYIFNKIKDVEIIDRLKKICAEESLDIELDALDLIVMNSDGSLRDAETMLEQLSLLGKRITTSLVNELVGLVSDEKLLELLALAMSSDTTETVKQARELMDSGVDPIVLMSQLASLIRDIIAGTYNIMVSKKNALLFGGQSLKETDLERLKHALKLLSEAEKQLRVSSERSTWFIATLLQLGSMQSPDLTQSSSRRLSGKMIDDAPASTSREAPVYKRKPDTPHIQGGLSSEMGGVNYDSTPYADYGDMDASQKDAMVRSMILRRKNTESFDEIWPQCIEKCHSKTLRQLLYRHGKLFSISEADGILIAYVTFGDENIKSRAERFLSSITKSMEMVLRCKVEVRIGLMAEAETSINRLTSVELPERLKQQEEAIDRERKIVIGNPTNRHINRSRLRDGAYRSISNSSELAIEANAQTNVVKRSGQEIPTRRIESIICEQKLETAWLQAVEKGTPGSLSSSKPEKNQVLPQDGMFDDQMESRNSMAVSSGLEDELNHELKVLKINKERILQKDQNGRGIGHYSMSPSLLHDASLGANANKDCLGYESGSANGGCGAFLCWNNHLKPHRRGKAEAKRRLSPFGKSGITALGSQIDGISRERLLESSLRICKFGKLLWRRSRWERPGNSSGGGTNGGSTPCSPISSGMPLLALESLSSPLASTLSESRSITDSIFLPLPLLLIATTLNPLLLLLTEYYRYGRGAEVGASLNISFSVLIRCIIKRKSKLKLVN